MSCVDAWSLGFDREFWIINNIWLYAYNDAEAGGYPLFRRKKTPFDGEKMECIGVHMLSSAQLLAQKEKRAYAAL